LQQRIDLTPALNRIRADTPDGFEDFYNLIHAKALPKHARREWVDPIYAPGAGRNFLDEAFRGSTKTTTRVTFVAYKVGLYPERANMIIQVSDESAKENSDGIGAIIAHNKMWKVCFPNVAPDPDSAWGAAGYNVKRIDMDYGDWQRKVAKRSGPSFVGYGRTARGIIGKHPDGVLVIDDIDDENTTASDRERNKTQTLLKGTIFPTRTDTTLTLAEGTPWTFNDAIAYMKSTGEFRCSRIPIYADYGLPTQRPMWPEKFPEEEIQRLRRLVGELEFARMFLLDLEAATGKTLKKEWLHEYPFEEIDKKWPVFMGVDYATTDEKVIAKAKGKDYFCIAVGVGLPGGGVVVTDGLRTHVSEGEAINLVRSWGMNYPTLQLVAMEIHGGGAGFYDSVLHQTRLPLVKATAYKKLDPTLPSAGDKGAKFQRQMAPIFQFTRAKISTAENEFLTEFKNEWLRWPLAEHDDTLDAVYYMLWAAKMSGYLEFPDQKPIREENWMVPRKKTMNPFAHQNRRG